MDQGTGTALCPSVWKMCIRDSYTGALQAFVAMGEHLEKDMTEYRELLDKSIDYMENQLYDGEYFRCV